MQSFPASFTALVTGASRGIGLSAATRILEQCPGAVVVAVARSATGSESLDRLVKRFAPRVTALDADITDVKSLQALAGQLDDSGRELELIFNCVGLLHDEGGLRPEKRLADVSVDHLQESYLVNAIGPVLVANHLQHLLPRGRRAVFATLSARVGSIGDNRLGGWYAYRMAKAAQNMATRNLSIELRRRCRELICVALHPGTVDTSLSRPFQGNVPPEKLFTPERAAQQLLDVIDSLKSEDNGGFFAWDGQPIEW